MDNPYGSYDIPEDYYATFIKHYERAILAGFSPSITERHKDFGPIVIDLDFKQAEKHPDRSLYGKND